MRDIDGIENAMSVLQPHWEAIEAEFDRQNERFLNFAKMDHEPAGRVLKAHLIVENFLTTYLTEHFGLNNLDDARLTFAQKAKLLPKAGSAASWVRPGIIQLNAVRNKYGHQLEHVVDFEDISAIMSVLRFARTGSHFDTPIDAMKAFAPVSCAFLVVPPKKLTAAFAEAFGYVVTKNPNE